MNITEMILVNCPKTRNEEFGQLLEALTEKYCQTVMKLDELIEQFDLLKGKNDKVIKFQEENFHKHDSGLDHILEMHRKLEEKQQEDNQKLLKDVENENVKLREIIAEQERKVETLLDENVKKLKSVDEEQNAEISKIHEANKTQDIKIENCDSRIDHLNTSLESHSEILEAILKELKEKDSNMGEMGEKLNTLMQERDGGNDLIKGEFDEKIRKCYEEIETKAPTETLNSLISQNAEEIASVRTTFNEKINDIEAKQVKMFEKQEQDEAKTEEIANKINSFNENSIQTTESLKGDQEIIKDDIKSLRQTQDSNEDKRVDTTHEIKNTISTMNEKQSVLSSNFGNLEDKVNTQMDSIDKKTAETQNNLKDLQHVTNTFDDKVANFSKSLRMEFRETKDDMVKKIDEHVQLAIQDSRARNEDLEDRILSSVKKHESTVKSLEGKVSELEAFQMNTKANSEGNLSKWFVLISNISCNFR